MPSTSISLLQRLCEQPDSDAWQQLMRQYAPMMRGWLRERLVPNQDVEDIIQDVMAVLIQRINEFQRQRAGSFRCWVRNITVNCMRDHLRKRNRSPHGVGGSGMVKIIQDLGDKQSLLSRQWEEEHTKHLVAVILKRVQPEFRETTWRAFQGVVLDQLPASQVAKSLGVSINAVFVAKSRVLARVRSEGAGLLEE